MNPSELPCRAFERVSSTLIKGFYAVFLFLFSFLTMSVLFGNIGYAYNLFLLFVFVCSFLALTVGIFCLLRRFAGKMAACEQIILFLFLIAFFCVQLYLGYRLRFASAFDFAAVYKGAVQWVETGTFADYYEYYHYFPNNLGAMAFLFLFFKLGSFLGITNYFMLGVVLNGVLISLTILFSYLAAKKLAGPAGGFACLYFFIVSLPFYIMAAAFYTDSLSMLFPVLFYNLYLSVKTAEGRSKNRRKLLYLAMAAVITIGAAIKFTVMIMAVAVIIDLLISGKFRQACVTATAVCMCFLLFQVSFQSYLYKYHLDREQAARMNTPLSHWVMMGLNSASQGAYHPEDYTFTRSFTNVEERNAAIREKIRERVKESGFDGLTRLFTRKLTKAFGDGTYALSDFLDDGPESPGKIHEYVLYDGAHYSGYKYATQAALITAYLFVTIGAAAAFWRRDKTVLAPFVAVFGLLLFLAAWESSSRYFLNFIPILFVCAAYGAAARIR